MSDREANIPEKVENRFAELLREDFVASIAMEEEQIDIGVGCELLSRGRFALDCFQQPLVQAWCQTLFDPLGYPQLLCLNGFPDPPPPRYESAKPKALPTIL